MYTCICIYVSVCVCLIQYRKYPTNCTQNLLKITIENNNNKKIQSNSTRTESAGTKKLQSLAPILPTTQHHTTPHYTPLSIDYYITFDGTASISAFLQCHRTLQVRLVIFPFMNAIVRIQMCKCICTHTHTLVLTYEQFMSCHSVPCKQILRHTLRQIAIDK